MYQKREISPPVGTKPQDQNQEISNDCDVSSGLEVSQKTDFPTFSYFLINNSLLYHFLANFLAHNKKMTEKSVFLEDDVTIILGLTALYPTGSEISRFWYIKTSGRKIAIENLFCYIYLSVHCGDFIEQIKKKSYTLNMFKRDYLGYKAYMRNSLSYLDLLLVIYITQKAFK